MTDFFEYLSGSALRQAAAGGFRLRAGPAAGGNVRVFDWEIREGFVFGVDYEAHGSTEPGSWNPLPEGHDSLRKSTFT